VKADEAKADFHDGELRVTPSDQQKLRRREIPIAAGAGSEKGAKP
jgi:hypothetical protein